MKEQSLKGWEIVGHSEAAEVPETYRPFLQAGLADTEAVEQEDLSVFTRGATLEPLVCQLVDCNR